MTEVIATGIWQQRTFGPVSVHITGSADLEQEKREVLEKLRLKAATNDLWGHIVDQFRGLHEHPKSAGQIASDAGFSQLIYRRASDSTYPVDIV
jgi:hypothetical protein